MQMGESMVFKIKIDGIRKPATFFVFFVANISHSFSPLFAQESTVPQKIQVTSPPSTVRGVSLQQRIYRFHNNDLSIGHDRYNSKISFVRVNATPQDTAYWGDSIYTREYQSPFGAGWTHNYSINIQCSYTWQDEANDESGQSCSYNAVAVTVGESTEIFDLEGKNSGGWYSYTARAGSGNILRSSVSSLPFRVYQYINESGAIYQFLQPASGTGSAENPSCGTYCWYASSIVYRNNEALSLKYVNRTSRDGGIQRLSSVESNLGFGIRIAYDERTGEYFNVANISSITSYSKQCTASRCDDIDVASVSYQYTPYGSEINKSNFPNQFAYLTSFTNTVGYSQKYSYDGDTFKIFNPSSDNSPIITFSPYLHKQDIPIKAATLVDGVGITTSFKWLDDDGPDKKVEVSYPAGDGTARQLMEKYTISSTPTTNPNSLNGEADWNWSVSSVEDALHHMTKFGYDGKARLSNIEYPEGNKKYFDYDSNGNVTSLKRTVKPDSKTEETVEKFEYEKCTYYDAMLCYLMKSHTDARGYKTSYEWNKKGLLFKKLFPDASGGEVKEIEIEYKEILGKDGRTIYLPASETKYFSSDKTAKVEWEYDTSGMVNVKKMTVAAGTETRVNCYSYDNAGNKISDQKTSGSSKACL